MSPSQSISFSPKHRHTVISDPFHVAENEDEQGPEENSDDSGPDENYNLHIGLVT